ncbi:MAG TPA: DUF5028 domain-containing protein [Candidatus Merdenecus merdavium]|nr:DUF5028 domain-containing protein [Candidatus Merdenecus merdavium]
MRKKLILMISVLVMIILVVRIYIVNKDVKKPLEIVYEKGEVVPFDGDFTESSEDRIEGYTIQVLDSELLTLEEFYEKFDPERELADDGYTEFYYIVKVVVGNESNDQGEMKGIFLDLFPLVGIEYLSLIDNMAFEKMNPDMPATSFALRKGTTKEMLIPYSFNPEVTLDREEIIKNPPMLQITEYPTRKLIKTVE